MYLKIYSSNLLKAFRITLSLIALFFSANAYSSELPVIPLAVNEDAPPLVTFLRYQNGYQGEISSDIINEATGWNKFTGKSINFGTPNPPTVAVFSVKNTSKTSGNWIFSLQRPSLKRFVLYDITHETVVRLDNTDRRRTLETIRTYLGYGEVISLLPGETRTYAMEIEYSESPYFIMDISTIYSFVYYQYKTISFKVAFSVAFFALFIFNLIFFLLTHRPSFIWLAITEFFFGMISLYMQGILTTAIFINKPLLVFVFITASISGFTFAIVQFFRSFIRLKKRQKSIESMLTFSLSFSALLFIAVMFSGLISEDVRNIIRSATLLNLCVVSLALPILAIIGTSRLQDEYRPIIFAWLVIGIIVIYSTIAFTGLFPNLPMSHRIVVPLGFFEGIMGTLSLGLSARKDNKAYKHSQKELAKQLTEKLEMSLITEKLTRDKAMALATVNDQSELLHASGHDSRQILFALNSVIDHMQKTNGDTAEGEILKSSAKYLQEVTSTTMSSPLSGHDTNMCLVLSEFNAETFLRSICKIHEGKAKSHGVKITIDVEENLSLLSDRSLLSRALSNLLSNSVRFTTNGEIICSAKSTHSGHVEICVSDTGAGINNATLEIIRQNEKAISRNATKTEGTGSGLRTAHYIVERLHGLFSIESRLGVGTQCKIIIPSHIKADALPIDIEDLQSQIKIGRVLDIPLKLTEVLPEPCIVIGVTVDESITLNLEHSKKYDLILVKPLSDALLSHPAMTQYLNIDT